MTSEPVAWEYLLPGEFEQRLAEVATGFTLAARNSAPIPIEAIAPLWAEIESERAT